MPSGGGIKCRIWWDVNTQSYVVSSTYSDKLVEGLKHVIPSNDRLFDKTTKFWYLKEQYGEAVKLVAEQVFGVGTVSFISKTVAEQTAQQQRNIPPPVIGGGMLSETDRALITFMRLLPYESARDAYRRAAGSFHPDRQNGDSEKMVQLNQSWSIIERELYKR